MDLTNIIRRFATRMNGTKWMLLFFAPISMISHTDDRTKENILERKRIAIVHAKFAFIKNKPYFAHFPHNGFGDALLRVTIAHIKAWNLWRVIRAITQVILAYRYCAFGDADFMSRYCAFNDTNFSCRYCRYNGAWFCVRNCRCNVVDFGVPLQRQSWRAVIGALCRVWGRAFWRPTYAL